MARIRRRKDYRAERVFARHNVIRLEQLRRRDHAQHDLIALNKAINDRGYTASTVSSQDAVAEPDVLLRPAARMSVADVSWAPPDGGPGRDVAACVDCERIVNRGDQPAMRTVQDRSGRRVAYVNSGFAPAYWGGFGYGGPMLAGFLLGEALATPPVFINGYGYGDAGYPGGGFGGDNFGGGDFGGGDLGGGSF